MDIVGHSLVHESRHRVEGAHICVSPVIQARGAGHLEISNYMTIKLIFCNAVVCCVHSLLGSHGGGRVDGRRPHELSRAAVPDH